MHIPVDSADAREQREAEAEQASHAADLQRLAAAERAVHQLEHKHLCIDGWLGESLDGYPIACLHCRPWLAQVPCRTCNTTPLACHLRGTCCDACDHHLNLRSTT